jgi:hypothetical protein
VEIGLVYRGCIMKRVIDIGDPGIEYEVIHCQA